MQDNRRYFNLRTRVSAAALPMVFGGVWLWAQSSSPGPITLQSLSTRIDALEQRVTRDEAGGAKASQQAGDGSAQAGGSADNGAAVNAALQKLTAQVAELQQQVTELRAEPVQERFVNDELRITHLEKTVSQLSNTAGNGATHSAGGEASVQAPFQVVGASGEPILKVSEGDGSSGMLELLSGGRTYAQLRTISNGNTGLLTIKNVGGDTANLGMTEDGPVLSMNDHGDRASIGRKKSTGALGLYLSKGEKTAVAMDLEGGTGNFHLFHGDAQVGSLSATENGAKLQLNVPGGGKTFSAGISDSDGDAFARWNTANGAVLVGTPTGKDLGIRLYLADGKTPTVGITENAQGDAQVAVAQGGVSRIAMQVHGKSAKLGVFDGSGKNFSALLTTHEEGGGNLELANGSGQIVALMDANPTNSQGRAVFTDSGGTPLAKIGAAGSHGEVLLSGPNKALAVWEMMLTGFH